MRDRAWRIYISEKVLIKRLERELYTTHQWYYVSDVNKNYYKKRLIIDFLEKKDYFFLKRNVTDNWTSKDKNKYSPNRSKGRWGRSGDNPRTREWNKSYFLKILKENGFK
jgi:hypothetical protein